MKKYSSILSILLLTSACSMTTKNNNSSKDLTITLGSGATLPSEIVTEFWGNVEEMKPYLGDLSEATQYIDIFSESRHIFTVFWIKDDIFSEGTMAIDTESAETFSLSANKGNVGIFDSSTAIIKDSTGRILKNLYGFTKLYTFSSESKHSWNEAKGWQSTMAQNTSYLIRETSKGLEALYLQKNGENYTLNTTFNHYTLWTKQ